jgi:amino acid adenylation domain-containing protein
MTLPFNTDQSSVSLVSARVVRVNPDFGGSSETGLQLLADKPRPVRRSNSVGEEAEIVGAGLLTELRELAAEEGVSLRELVLAGFAALLFRYTGEVEFEIACERPGFAGEDSDGRQGILLFRMLEDPSFSQLVRGTSEAKPSSARLQAPGQSSSRLWFWSGSSTELPTQLGSGVRLDLGLCLESAEQEAKLHLWYATDLFERATSKRMLLSLKSILTSAVANPQRPVSQLPVLSEAERKLLLEDWNRTASDAWHGQCLNQLFEEQVERSPEQVAVECEGSRVTYAELNAKANQLAHYLITSGAVPHSHIGICLAPSVEFAIAILAALKAGCACVPLDPKYPADRIAYMLEDAGARFVLTQPGLLNGTLPDDVRVLDLWKARDEVSHQPRQNPNLKISAADIAYLIYTSGSTGKPRGVLLPHAGLANYNLAAARYYNIRNRDRVLQFCSLSFDVAVEEVFATLISGATLVFRSKNMPLDVPGFLEWIRLEKITVLDLPTAYWHEWVSQFPELRNPVPAGLRLVIVGGEKALATALATWRERQDGVRWVNTYGPTEASIAVTRYDPDEEHVNVLPANIPIGRPVENCRLYVLDRHRNPVPIGVAGELYIGGIGVAKGYLNRPELTAEKFIVDPFSKDEDARLYRTGDLARFLESGLIEYLGRQDDQVKIRGFRIELGEVEELLTRHPLVGESVVVAIDDPVQGKTLIAYCSPAGDVKAEAGDLRAFVAGKLPEYMVPSAFVVLDALPKTPNGKIDRRTLSHMEPPKTLISKAVDLPTTSLETQLKKIWEETLGRKPIGIRDNFFELGGHSLLAARLMQKVSRMSGKTVPLALLFEAPTIERLAALLERNEWLQQWSCLVPIQAKGSRPAFFCVHGVGGNVVGFRELARLMSPEYPFYGFQAQGLDGTRTPFARVEEMAAHYIREMRGVQPEGPFFLGGYSFGGLVAYEMARQLYEGGEDVALLALLDTYPGELEAVTTSIWKLLLEPKRLRVLGDLPGTIKKSVERRVKGAFLSKTLKEVLQANQGASAGYVLQPYEGKTTLFRAEQSSLRAFDDPHAAWATLAAGGLEIEEIAGDHGDILMVPQVDELAKKLKAAIDSCADRNCAESHEEEALA